MALISFCSVFITVEDFSGPEPSANHVKPESNQLFTNLQPRIPHTCFQCTFFCEILGLKIKMFSSWQWNLLPVQMLEPGVPPFCSDLGDFFRCRSATLEENMGRSWKPENVSFDGIARLCHFEIANLWMSIFLELLKTYIIPLRGHKLHHKENWPALYCNCTQKLYIYGGSPRPDFLAAALCTSCPSAAQVVWPKQKPENLRKNPKI